MLLDIVAIIVGIYVYITGIRCIVVGNIIAGVVFITASTIIGALYIVYMTLLAAEINTQWLVEEVKNAIRNSETNI